MRKKHNLRREKPLHKQSIEDIGEFFDGLPAFSFVFLSSEGTNGKGPTLISAVELVGCRSVDGSYDGPYPESMFQDDLRDAEKHCPELIQAVEARVEELRRRSDESFILLGHAQGMKKPRLDYSKNYSGWDQLREELVQYLQQEIAWCTA